MSTSPSTQSSPLSMEISVTPLGAEVHLRGMLIAGQTEQLRDAVKPLIEIHDRILIDLNGLERMDSTGLGTLVTLLITAKKAGKNLELKNLNKRMRDLLKLTNLLSLFGTYDDSGVIVG